MSSRLYLFEIFSIDIVSALILCTPPGLVPADSRPAELRIELNRKQTDHMRQTTWPVSPRWSRQLSCGPENENYANLDKSSECEGHMRRRLAMRCPATLPIESEDFIESVLALMGRFR